MSFQEAGERQTIYDKLVNYINENVPLLGNGFGSGEEFFSYTEIIIPILILVLFNILGNVSRALLINKILPRYIHDRKIVLSIGNTTKYALLLLGLTFALSTIGLGSESILNQPLFGEGDGVVRLFDLFRVIILLGLLVFISGKLKTVFVKQVLSKYSDDIGVSQSIGTIIQYIFIILGGFIIIQASNVHLGSLNLLAGALGVGIGFGLQNIANNFISGLIILFERPIKVGDRIEVGEVSGDVVKVSPRATTVNTNDNISIIIPNSDVINKQVINWSHNDRKIRLHIPVGVSYNEDPAVIKQLLLEVADGHKDVLKRPAPDVLFVGYGDSSLDFDLLAWTSSYIDRPIILKSQLYYLIFEKFKESNVEIPYPQRDLHIKSGLHKNDKAK